MTTSLSFPSVAVIGCGYWGKNLVRNFAELGRLAAVCDRRSELAAKLGEQYGVPALDLPEILATPHIAALVIATPAEQHAALVEEGLLAGKHILVEKPLSLDVVQARRLNALAKERGLILMVGHLLQYHPAFLALKRQVEDGRIGRLQYIYSNRLNLGKIRTEENILWSFAPHDISMILSLVGADPISVTSVGHNYLHQAIADVTTTHLRFASGTAAHIHVSWLHPFKEQRLVVVGDAGMAVFDDSQPWDRKLLLFPHHINWEGNVPVPERADAIAVPVEQAEPLNLECLHFLESVATNSTPRTDGNEGVRVLAVLAAAQNSMETGLPVRIEDPPAADYFVHETAVIDAPSQIGSGTRIWHFSHVLKNSRIGKNCNIGQNVVIGPDVSIGDRCKIQNNVSVYPGVTLEEGVFCGPSMVFTNVINPRAEIERKSEYRPTLVKRGATIGANATIVCGHTIGRYALIGAGAVITRDVPDHALMVGNPARILGWVCMCGTRLPDGEQWTEATCPACGARHRRTAAGKVECN